MELNLPPTFCLSVLTTRLLYKHWASCHPAMASEEVATVTALCRESHLVGMYVAYSENNSYIEALREFKKENALLQDPGGFKS